MKKVLVLVLILGLLLCSCGTEKIPTDYDFTETSAAIMNNIFEETPSPVHSHLGGEWAVLCSVRYGATPPESWCGYDTYYENLCSTLTENDGVLSSTKHTNYSRAIMALTAIGKDPTNVAGYDLFDNFMSMEQVTKQGIPGSIFALIALDTVGYGLPEGSDVTREKLIGHILSEEYPGGGWALIGDEPDVDITAQTIQALAPYYGETPDVTAAVDRAIAVLSEVQKPDGGFFAWEGENSQSAAQVIIALTAMGIDIRTDERFIKDGNWIGSYLMQYYLGDGAFCHTLGNGEDQMATEQCMLALIALQKFESGEGRLYDFSKMHSGLAE